MNQLVEQAEEYAEPLAAFDADHPDAGSLFADAHGGPDPNDDDGSGHPDGEASKAAIDASGTQS